MHRFTRNVAILEIGCQRLVYVRDRNANADDFDDELAQNIIHEVAVVRQGK